MSRPSVHLILHMAQFVDFHSHPLPFTGLDEMTKANERLVANSEREKQVGAHSKRDNEIFFPSFSLSELHMMPTSLP